MENIKDKNSNVLWGVVAEISNTLSRRESIPPSERTGTYKDVTDALYSEFKDIVCTLDDRMPDNH